MKANLGSFVTIEEEKCLVCGGILVTRYGARVEMTTCVDGGYEDFDYD